MGFWDSVKKAASSAKCMAGLHSGEYRPVKGKPECNLEMTCPDCNKYLTKIEHKFGKWDFIKEKQCDAVRECGFCNEKEQATKHQWVQSKNRKCEVVKDCQRCGLHEFVRVEHGVWHEGVGHGDGTHSFTCADCLKNERRTKA